MKKATIIFDFDGTIADSFAFVSQLIAEHGGQPDWNLVERRRQFAGLTMRGMARKLGIPLRRQLLMFVRGRKLMTRQIADVKPFEGIEAALKTLHEQGYTLFALSSNRNKNIQLFLQQHDLAACFAKTQGDASILGKKRAFRKMLRQSGLRPQDCIVVGDEVGDLQAARHIGIPAVAVAWGYNKVATLKAENPVAIAEKPADLVQIFNDLQKQRASN